VEEINKAGGILGRPVEYVVLDGKETLLIRRSSPAAHHGEQG
jgi:ABC-type branched-subunit amino acid transport system substrate-binding protein